MNCLKYKTEKLSTQKRLKGQKKYICVFTVTCQKNLGSVGRDYFLFFIFFLLLSTKPEIVVPESDSGISFSKFLVK